METVQIFKKIKALDKPTNKTKMSENSEVVLKLKGRDEYDMHTKRIMVSNHGKKELISMQELSERCRSKAQIVANRLVNTVMIAQTKFITINVFIIGKSCTISEYITMVDSFHRKLEGVFEEYSVKKLNSTNCVMAIFRINTGLHGPKKLMNIGNKVNNSLQTIQVANRVLYQILIPTQRYDTLYIQKILEATKKFKKKD